MFQRKTAPALFPASATAGGRAGKTIYPTPHGIPPLYTKSNKSKPISVARVLLAAMLLVIVYWGFQRQYTTTLTESGATTTNENLYYADIDTSTIKVAIPGQDYDPGWGLRSMRRKFNCEEHFSHPRPLYTSEQWDYMRRVYQVSVLGQDPQQQPLTDEPAFRVPYQVRQDPDKGRGIYATRKIAMGSVVWTRARTVSFDDGASYRKFLFSVGDDGLACDIMQWGKLNQVSWYLYTSVFNVHGLYLDLSILWSSSNLCPQPTFLKRALMASITFTST